MANLKSESLTESSPGSASALAPGLYVVATPIGNLRDITLRALDVLSGADRILAEDTRRTRTLLSAHRLTGRLEALHDHNEDARTPTVLGYLADGEVVALVSDAGTPLISDPGYRLVRAAREAGHRVTPIPGASALTASLSIAGLPTDSFTFAGFLPPKSAARRRALEDLRDVPGTLVLYETGPRLAAMLTDCADILGEREARIVRELTKTFEEVRSGTLASLIPDTPPKGEIVVLIAAGMPQAWTPERIDAALRERSGLPAKQASREVADLSGLPRRDLYNRLLELRGGDT